MQSGNEAILQGEQIEADTWESVWQAAPEELREKLGMSYERDGLAAVFRASKAPSWFFNRMMGFGLEGPAQREAVQSQIDRFLAQATPFGACIVEEATPAELPRWLEENGLARTTTLARMVRSTENLPDSDSSVSIHQVGSDEARHFAETTARGFGLPDFCVNWFGRLCGREGWHLFLAYDASRPVASGALRVHGEIGWIGFGSTHPEYRGQGVHRAMMAHRMAHAADLGCTRLQTETNLAVGDEPTPSLNNMKRLGFEMAYSRPNYVFSPT
jgi:GNAT superfamily N-acetyltransferase